MENKELRTETLKRAAEVENIIGYDRILNRREPDVRDYLTNTLHSLLCDRYSVSYHTTKQKLVDLVEKELSI